MARSSATLRGIRDRPVYVPGGWDDSGAVTTARAGGYSPGYVVNDEIVSVETTLWDIHDNGKMVWSATTPDRQPDFPVTMPRRASRRS